MYWWFGELSIEQPESGDALEVLFPTKEIASAMLTNATVLSGKHNAVMMRKGFGVVFGFAGSFSTAVMAPNRSKILAAALAAAVADARIRLPGRRTRLKIDLCQVRQVNSELLFKQPREG